jgi:hypothetical protein
MKNAQSARDAAFLIFNFTFLIDENPRRQHWFDLAQVAVV